MSGARRTDDSESPWNPPAVMLARFCFVMRVPAAGLGLLFAVQMFSQSDPVAAVRAAMALGAAFILQAILARTGRTQECAESFGEYVRAPFAGPDAEVEHMRELLLRRRDLEAQRGTRAFDPWESLRLQREISAYAREHPKAAAFVESNTDRS